MSEVNDEPPGHDESAAPRAVPDQTSPSNSDVPTPEMDRRVRRERRKGERRQKNIKVDPDRRKTADRRAGPRRRPRSINQYDMEEETLEFIRAINRFKERSGRSFPTWSEVLGILKELGYERRADRG